MQWRERALQRELLRTGLDLAGLQARQEQAALEQAIWRVEVLTSWGDEAGSTFAALLESHHKPPPDVSHLGSRTTALTVLDSQVADQVSNQVAILPPSRSRPLPVADVFPRQHHRVIAPLSPPGVVVYPIDDQPKRQHIGWRVLALLGDAARLAIVAIAAVAIFFLISKSQNGTERQPSQASQGTIPAAELAARWPTAAPTAAPSATSEPAKETSPYPRPTTFGVYAIHNGGLIELKPVPTTPVDPRLKNIFQTNQPATVRIADGRINFLLYRRDFIVSAPEKVSVKIVAPVARTMKFDGTAQLVAVSQIETWLIRSNGYEFQVLPVPDNREMILVQPESAQFSLPPGRYALMVGGQPYDFVIDGAVTDPAHCVESAQTARGPVFYDCPPKR